MPTLRRVFGDAAHSERRVRDFLVGVSGFLIVVLLATTGIVEGTSRPAQAGPGDSYADEGDIAGSNPFSSQVGGVTENDLAVNCEYPPESQGVDGWVFQLPDGFVVPAPFTVTGTSDAAYDLDVFFYDAECAFLSGTGVATENPDESGEVPGEAKYIVVDQFIGANTHVVLCVGDPDGCLAPTGSPPPPSEPPPIQGEQRVSIQTDTSLARFRERFTLSGMVDGDAECGPPQSHRVGVSRKVLGSDEYKSVDRSIPVRNNGKWSLRLRSSKSARYVARVSPSVGCESAQAGPVIVHVRVKVGPLIAPDKEGCGPLRVTGSVSPSYEGTTVKLQRHTDRKGKWRPTGENARLNKDSDFKIKLPECGLYRVLWPRQAPSNKWGFAKLRHGRA